MQRIIPAVLLLGCLTLAKTVLADVEIKRDVVYGHKDGMALVYDVIRPENPNGAAVAFMMSGGWFSRWSPPETLAEGFFSDMLDAGFTMIPVYHGSAPRYKVPEAYADVSRAIRHIKLHAAEHGFDPGRLGVTGGSAGGHLSLMIGLDADSGDPQARDPVMRGDNRVATVVAYFPPVDLRPITGPNDRFPALDFSPELSESISPILHADAGDPPTLLIHGDADDLVPISESEDLYAEFQQQGVEAEFVTIPGGQHGFRGENAVKADRLRLEWFQEYLN